jgi:hypothetical protein
MDPDLMRLNDYIEMEQERTRHVTQHVVAFMVLAELNKAQPDLERLKTGLREMMARSDAFLAALREQEEQA